MIKDLINLADKFDRAGLVREAEAIDKLIKKIAQETPDMMSGSGPSKAETIFQKIMDATADFGTEEEMLLEAIKMIDTPDLWSQVDRMFTFKVGSDLLMHLNVELESGLGDQMIVEEIKDHLNSIFSSTKMRFVEEGGDLGTEYEGQPESKQVSKPSWWTL